MSRRTSFARFSRLARIAVGLLVSSSLLRAGDEPSSFTFDLPVVAHQLTPSWLGQPVAPATAFATLGLPITAMDPKASLLITVFFEEKPGGFLRVNWQAGGRAQRLSDNFYEGIGMSNQRSLLITPDVIQEKGTLSFQSSGPQIGISRIKMEWLEPKTEWVTPVIPDALVQPSMGAAQMAIALNGQIPSTHEAGWLGWVVTVTVADQPLRVEQGVEFSVQLDEVPIAARLALKISGLALTKHLVVWINQKRAGIFSPAVPDLLEEGYTTPTNTKTYVGWREGSFFLPASFLKSGVNTVQFSAEGEDSGDDGGAGTAEPENALALKEVMLQCRYGPSPVPVAASVPTSPVAVPEGPAAAPTGPTTNDSLPLDPLPLPLDQTR